MKFCWHKYAIYSRNKLHRKPWGKLIRSRLESPPKSSWVTTQSTLFCRTTCRRHRRKYHWWWPTWLASASRPSLHTCSLLSPTPRPRSERYWCESTRKVGIGNGIVPVSAKARRLWNPVTRRWRISGCRIGLFSNH